MRLRAIFHLRFCCCGKSRSSGQSVPVPQDQRAAPRSAAMILARAGQARNISAAATKLNRFPLAAETPSGAPAPVTVVPLRGRLSYNHSVPHHYASLYRLTRETPETLFACSCTKASSMGP